MRWMKEGQDCQSDMHPGIFLILLHLYYISFPDFENEVNYIFDWFRQLHQT